MGILRNRDDEDEDDEEEEEEEEEEEDDEDDEDEKPKRKSKRRTSKKTEGHSLKVTIAVVAVVLVVCVAACGGIVWYAVTSVKKTVNDMAGQMNSATEAEEFLSKLSAESKVPGEQVKTAYDSTSPA